MNNFVNKRYDIYNKNQTAMVPKSILQRFDRISIIYSLRYYTSLFSHQNQTHVIEDDILKAIQWYIATTEYHTFETGLDFGLLSVSTGESIDLQILLGDEYFLELMTYDHNKIVNML